MSFLRRQESSVFNLSGLFKVARLLPTHKVNCVSKRRCPGVGATRLKGAL
jgi:hypothetical protein